MATETPIIPESTDHSSDSQQYLGYEPDLQEEIPDYPPVDFSLPAEITGEDPHDTFNSVALPRLRELFPAYYTEQLKRVEQAQAANPEIGVELDEEDAFRSEALRLRIMLDAADAAAKDGDHVLMTLDNDKTTSRKPDSSLHLGVLATHDRAWDSLSDGQQRSSYHRMIARDVDETIISPAVIVGVNALKEKYRDGISFGMVTSNVQEYLDIFCVKLNNLTNGAFDPDYMIGYDDGRFSSDMKHERRMTRGDKNANPKDSPTLAELYSSDISPVYTDASRYIDFDGREAKSVSNQDLKLGVLLRLKDEDPYRRVSVVHIDDMPSSMRSDVPGVRYVELPHDAWFKLVENGLF